VYIGMIVHNEEWIVEYALKSTYEFVDKIIVVDGSPTGPSTDRTVEIVKSIGPKIKVIQGTYKNKLFQRQAYIDEMEKGYDHWCILQDADEVYKKSDIKRLVNYLHTASNRTKLFSWQWIHFYGDCWHILRGDSWDRPRDVGAFRLVPGIKQLKHHWVGREKDSKEGRKTGFSGLKFPERIILKDVCFFHYTGCDPFEHFVEKRKLYFHRDREMRNRNGKEYSKEDWGSYYVEVVLPEWENRKIPQALGSKVEKFAGTHPEVMKSFIERNVK